MVEEVKRKHPQIYKDIKQVVADKGYDSGENCRDFMMSTGLSP